MPDLPREALKAEGPFARAGMTPSDFRRLITLELELFEQTFKSHQREPRRLASEWLDAFSAWRKFRQ